MKLKLFKESLVMTQPDFNYEAFYGLSESRTTYAVEFVLKGFLTKEESERLYNYWSSMEMHLNDGIPIVYVKDDK